MQNLKNIHIGNFICQRVKELEVDLVRICNFLKCTEEEVEKMYQQESLDSLIVLKWSKLLEYDFFRLYSQHIILYAPQSSNGNNNLSQQKNKSSLPQFRKNIYTKEIIEFLLEKLEKGQKTKTEIISEYGIPKTTLYKWLKKYSVNK